ncbi:GAF domain-containing protein [candidate division KSB1 bacterium]|nr:MAG: GAF domain-containing protein [candidate division KSB1 bacterium]
MQDHLLEISKNILAESDVDLVLTLAIDHMLELTGAERGLIILFDDKGNEIFQTARRLSKKDIEHPKFQVSFTIIHHVRSTGQPLCLQNAFEDSTLQKSESAARLKILSVICLPLLLHEKLFGVLYLDNRTVEGIFEKSACDFATRFADFVSLAAFNSLERKKLTNRLESLEQELRIKYDFTAIIGHHPQLVKTLKIISQIAEADATVLIYGESGTGKELVARALHFNSSRRDKPFVPINCSAFQENLIESELFGHSKGAFTGAYRDKIGWFQKADGGTIFLDEISEMSPALQAKLLRVLQSGEFSPVGSAKILKSFVRIVAATNRDLPTLVQHGSFREDLYYRLNVIDIPLPQLRERKSDIPLLIDHFLDKFGHHHSIRQKALDMLLQYDYPGNIRELENIIERAAILAREKSIDMEHLPPMLTLHEKSSVSHHAGKTLTQAKRSAAQNAEKEYIIDYLRASHGHITNAAKMAGVDVSDFHKAMKRHKIYPGEFK